MYVRLDLGCQAFVKNAGKNVKQASSDRVTLTLSKILIHIYLQARAGIDSTRAQSSCIM